MSTRPELGELKPGQEVMVCRSPNDMRGRETPDRYIPARVVKVARVWVTLERSDLVASQIGHREWRMRLDTQDEATQYSGSNDRFLTLAQYEWEQTLTWARGVLADQGLQIRDSRSPWYGREVELADLLSKGLDTSQS